MFEQINKRLELKQKCRFIKLKKKRKKPVLDKKQKQANSRDTTKLTKKELKIRDFFDVLRMNVIKSVFKVSLIF
jgi:hypothetical protein